MSRIAVVTGASSGIGGALVGRLQTDGWRTVGLQRRPSQADENEECDISDRASVEAAAEHVLERHPRIDLLVCNAGVAGRTSFLDGDVAAIERVMRVNYLGSVWTVLAFLPGLGRGSHVVNVVSVAGTVAGGPYSAHGATMEVLFAGGNVRGTRSPNIGPRGDHIYCNVYGNIAAGANRGDAVLGGPGTRP